MHRRELLHLLAAAALTPALASLPAEQRLALGRALHLRLGVPLRVLTLEQDTLVIRVAELIIPETDTPGATTVQVDRFIDLLLAEWYDDAERDRFLKGLAAIDVEASHEQGALFVNCRPETQTALLSRWDAGHDEEMSATAAYHRLKDLTIYGYFTSERVMKEVTKPVIYHPAFEGCAPFTPGARR